MKITYIHHSSFLVETDSCYYLFDYEKGNLPQMNVKKPIFVLFSHGHEDHYNPAIFSKLNRLGMQNVYAILSEDIEPSALKDVGVFDAKNVLRVSFGKEYRLCLGQTLTTFKSTDEGVAFLIEDNDNIIYHAGDLNDWVWEGESASYNEQMTKDYREQINLLSETLNHRKVNAAFVVLDPRQEKNCDRGLCYFLEQISVEKVYPMHYWGKSDIIETFVREHPEYREQIWRNYESV